MKRINFFLIIMVVILLCNCSSDDDASNDDTSNVVPEFNISLIYTITDTEKGNDILVPGNILSVKYTNNNLVENTEFRWYRSDDANGGNKEIVSDESESIYTITSADADKYINVEVTIVQEDGVSGEDISSEYSPIVRDIKSRWDGESITSYTIVGTKFVKSFDYSVDPEYLTLQQDVAKHEEIIKQMKKIIPSEYFTRINKFTLYLGQVGYQNTLGRVGYSIASRDKFDFEIAIDNAYEVPFNDELGLNYTIAHELGHILTLNDTQASTNSVSSVNCDSYFFQTCFFKNSYLNMFYNQYWVSILDEYNNSSSYVNFYNKNKDQFVSQYAASQIPEDIAETLMMYFLNSSNYTGSTIADQKVNGMNNYSDFQEIRSFATNNIPNSSLQRGSFYISKRANFSCGTQMTH